MVIMVARAVGGTLIIQADFELFVFGNWCTSCNCSLIGACDILTAAMLSTGGHKVLSTEDQLRLVVLADCSWLLCVCIEIFDNDIVLFRCGGFTGVCRNRLVKCTSQDTILIVLFAH